MGSQRVVLDFTVFESDGTTPFFGTGDGSGGITDPDFQTPDSVLSHDRPYLKTPRNFTATEVDFVAGTSEIGAISVGVMDVRTTSTDQTSGQVTSKIADYIGKRAVLRRWVPSLSQYIVLFEGVVESYSVDTDDLLIYWFHLRDTREFERGGELFKSNYVLFGGGGRQGPAVPYGKSALGKAFEPALQALLGEQNAEDATYLVNRIRPWSAETFEERLGAGRGGGATPGAGAANKYFALCSDPDPSDGIHYGLTSVYSISIETAGSWSPYGFIPILNAIGFPTKDAEGTYRFRDFRVRWRPDGGTESDWVELDPMPAHRYLNISPGPNNWLYFEDQDGNQISNSGCLYLASENLADLPPEDEPFELQVLANEITPGTPFFWDRGTSGDLLQEIQDGLHTDEVPKERYDASELADFAANTPNIRFILKAPVNDRRKWIEENIFKPLTYAPALTTSLDIRPVSWLIPDDTESIPALDPDTIQPIGEWTESVGELIEGIEFTYIKESYESYEAALERKQREGGFSPNNEYLQIVDEDSVADWERLIETEVTFEDSIDDPPPGAKTLKYNPVTIRDMTGLLHTAINGDNYEPLGHRLAKKIFETATQEITGNVRYEAEVTSTAENLQLALGDWVRVYLPWMPDYRTGKRGTRRYMQIYAISDEDPDTRKLRLRDGGVPDYTDDPDIVAPDNVDCLSGGTLISAPGTGKAMRIFEADDDLVNVCSEDVTIDKVLLIAGGGGGGGGGGVGQGASGGGGAGGVLIAEDVVIGAGESIPVRIGAGGAVNSPGENSVLWVDGSGNALDPLSDPEPSATTAEGGGEGGEGEENGGAGGSGGGGGTGGSVSNDGSPGGDGTAGQGNDGGDGQGIGDGATCYRGGGGGGGSYAEAGSDGLVQPIHGTLTEGGDGGGATTLDDWGVIAGSGGKGGSFQEGPSCSNGGGEFTEQGASGSGYGAGGGGGAWTDNNPSLPDRGGAAGQDGYVAVIYKGGSVPGLTIPTITSLSVTASPLNEPRVTISEADFEAILYAGYRVRIDFAIGETEPAASSGDWETGGYLTAAGTLTLDSIPTGSTVWVRARAEADNFLPSGWSSSSSASADEAPAIVRAGSSYDADTRVLTVTWAENQFTAQVEIRAILHDRGTIAERPLTLIDTVDASLRTYTLSSLQIPEGKTLSVDLVPKPALGFISEGTDGQVAHHIADDAENPFSVSDWDNEGGVDTIAVEGGTGYLRFDSDEAASNRTISYNAASALSDMLVRGRAQYDQDYLWGIEALVNGRNDRVSMDLVMHSAEARLSEYEPGPSRTDLDGPTATTSEDADAWYWLGVWADDNGDAAGADFSGGLTFEGMGHGRSSGQAGWSHRKAGFGQAQTTISHFYLDSGRYLTVTGLSTGYKVKVRDSSGVTLAQATESGGTATVDLVGVNPTEAVEIQVTTSADSEIATLEPTWDYIAGGSTATFTEGTGEDGEPVRVSRSRSEGGIATTADITTRLDSLTFNDDLDLMLDDDLNLILDD